MSETLIDGIVTQGHGKRFMVFAEGRYYNCHLRKKVKFKTELTTPVAVGDDVRITVISDDEGAIDEVRKRRTVLSRPDVGRRPKEHVMAANIDALIAVGSVNSPPLKPGLIDRFIIAAEIGGLTPVIVVNKVDLKFEDGAAEAIEVYQSLDFEIILTSATEETGFDQLRDCLKKHSSILAGHSGVGKSTLLNKLLPGINLPTKMISQATGRGQHTTSHIELFHLPDGGSVIDSPGIKVLGFWQLEKEQLALYYPEMEPYLDDCRFTGCSHTHEPDCAVREAVDSGVISSLRYQNYTQIYNSL